MCGHLDWFQFFSVIMLQWITLLTFCVFIFILLQLFLLNRFLEMGLLSQKVRVYTFVIYCQMLFQKKGIPDCTSTSSSCITFPENGGSFPLCLTSSDFITKLPFKAFHLHIFILGLNTLSCLSSGIYNRQAASGACCVKLIYVMWNTRHPNPVLDLVSPKSVPVHSLGLNSGSPVASSSPRQAPLQLPQPILSTHSLVLNPWSASAFTGFSPKADISNLNLTLDDKLKL